MQHYPFNKLNDISALTHYFNLFLYSFILLLSVWTPLHAQTAGSGSPAKPLSSQHAKHTTHSFALIGDQPYSAASEKATSDLLQTLNDDPAVPWILHVGDIKGGGESCSNELLNRRINQLESIQKPVMLVPGDNEWADCHRSSNGGFNPLDRLAYLRKIAFHQTSKLMPTAHPQIFLRPTLQSQAGYPEHAMWTVAGTLFISLNIPGSNNNLENPSSRKNTQKEVQAEYQNRMKAVRAWINQAAQEFKQRSELKELVIAIQGNPIDGSGDTLSNSAWLGGEDGYAEFRGAVSNLTEQIQRPVLLIHGDTHRFKWDQPQLDPGKPSKLHRLEAWGHPFLNNWVKVTIHSGTDQPFQVESLSLN